MLSNKLTFSLASLIVILALVLASTSVMAAPTIKITEVDGTTRTSLTIRVTSSEAHTYDEWNSLAPTYRLLDKVGRELGTEATPFTATTPSDPFGTNAGFVTGSPLRLSSVHFTTTISAEQTSVSAANTPRSVKAMVSTNVLGVSGMVDETFVLPPIIGNGVLAISGPTAVSSPYTVTLTFTAAAVPTVLPSPVYDFTFDPPVDRISALSDVTTEGTGDEATHTYTFMVEPMMGSTSLTVTVDPAYAQNAMGKDIAALKATDAPPGAVLKKNQFQVFQSSSANGIELDAAKSFLKSEASSLASVNLEDLLRLGGTIEIALPVGAKGSTTHTVVSDGDDEKSITAAQAAKAAYRLIITEVMWGLDKFQPVGSQHQSQWIEVYNNGDALKASDTVTLMYHKNARVDNIGKAVTVSGTTYVVTDRLSTINRFGNVWGLKGQSGNTQEIRDGAVITAPTDLISMYRKVTLDSGKYKAKADAKIDGVVTRLDGLGDGGEAGSWEASVSRTNIVGRFVGSPGTVHVTHGGTAGITKGFGKNPGDFSATGVIINEVRNDTSDANLDWIELYHFNDTAGATPKNLENWTLSIVTRKPKAGKTESDAPTSGNFEYKDTNLFSLPKFKLQPGEYLVVYNRHPGDTILAGGVNVEDVLAGKQVNKGASHLYIVREGLNLPSSGKFLLLLRHGNDKAGTHEKLEDYAGNGFFSRVETNKFNTDVWPFIGWTAPGDVDNADFGGNNTFASTSQSFGRGVALSDKGMYRPKSRANRAHKDDWMAFGFVGTGYDREVDHASAPGTPGYENRTVNVIHDDRESATGKSAYDFGGTVTISEVMYDAGPRWNLVQWIELYNSSMTETVNLDGWTMEIRNEATDVESYVDASFKFNANTEILPNQTLLIVSGTGANDVPQERVYNLFEHHRQQLGLTARDSRLLSREGFYIRLTSKIMQDGREKDIDDLTAAEINLILMDEVGNVAVDGAARVHQWDLPPRDPAVRQSLVRVYGTQEIDGTPDMASDGQMMESWKQSDISGAALTFYGHRNDISTPGYRLGGPLPVQLSSFRPVRDKATSEVTIRWITQSELNNAGFNILRSEARVGPYTVVNVKGIIPGHGTTSEKHVYEWKDTTAKPNVVYYYQIEDVSLDGKRTRLATTHLRGNVAAGGKLTTRWGDLKSSK